MRLVICLSAADTVLTFSVGDGNVISTWSSEQNEWLARFQHLCLGLQGHRSQYTFSQLFLDPKYWP